MLTMFSMFLIIIQCLVIYALYHKIRGLEKYKKRTEEFLNKINDEVENVLEERTIRIDAESMSKEFPEDFGITGSIGSKISPTYYDGGNNSDTLDTKSNS